MQITPLEERTPREMRVALTQLQPRGWSRELEGVTRGGKFWLALYGIVLAARNRALAFVHEMIPGSVHRVDVVDVTYPVETLAAWELDCGIPTNTALSDAQRRANLLGHLLAVGGNSAAYFTGLILASFGVVITIETFEPVKPCMAPCAPLYAASAHFHWRVHGPAVTPVMTRALIIDLIEKYCPAHTVVSFVWDL